MSEMFSSSGTGTNWMVLDSSGRPNVTNTAINSGSGGNSDVNYFWSNTPGVWNFEPQFSTRTERTDYRMSYLGLNNVNEPRVLYEQADGSGATAGERTVYYQKKTGASWTGETAVTPQGYFWNLSAYYRKSDDSFRAIYFLKVDGSTSSSGLYYSSQTSAGNWGSPLLIDDNGGTSFDGASCAFNSASCLPTGLHQDSAQNLHMVYYSTNNSSNLSNIMYVKTDDSGVKSIGPEKLAFNIYNSTQSINRALGIVSDSSGVPHVAFADTGAPNFTIRYASRSSTGWVVSVATAGVAKTPHLDIELDVAGHPVISFAHSPNSVAGNQRLGFSHYNGCGSWQTYRAPSVIGGDEGDNNNLAISTTGKIHIIGQRISASNTNVYGVWADTQGPNAIGSISSFTAAGTIALNWFAPSDVDGTGSLQNLPGGSLYRIMYTTDASKAQGAWDPKSADTAFTAIDIATSCVNSGSAQNYTGSFADGTYYFRIFTRDEYPDNFSPVSAGSTVTVSGLGCGLVKTVRQAGGGDSTTIQGAVGLLPTVLSTTSCVMVIDSANYSEQVTVQGIATNGYRIKIIADPALTAPVINPPVNSTAAFNILNDSVTLQNINIAPTLNLKYGVLASSADVVLSSIAITDSVGWISQAGVRVSTNSSISYSTITVAVSTGIYVEGTQSVVAYVIVRSSYTSAAVLLNGAYQSSISHSVLAGGAGSAGPAPGNSGLRIIASSVVTVSSSVLTGGVGGDGANTGGGGHALYATGSSSITVNQSALTGGAGGNQPGGFGGGAGGYGLFFDATATDWIADSFMAGGKGGDSGGTGSGAGGYGAVFQSSSNAVSVLRSTFTGANGGVNSNSSGSSPAGDGGHGLFIITSSSSSIAQSSMLGGVGGTGATCGAAAGYGGYGGNGLYINLSSAIAVVQSTMSGNAGGFGGCGGVAGHAVGGNGLLINAGLSHGFTQIMIAGGAGGGSGGNVGGDGGVGLTMVGSSSNTVAQAMITGGLGGSGIGNGASVSGVILQPASQWNTISLSTITSQSSTQYALYFFGAASSSNTIRRSYIFNANGTAAFLSSDRNTVDQSTMIALGGVGNYGLYVGGSSNAVSQSVISAPGAMAVQVQGDQNIFNSIIAGNNISLNTFLINGSYNAINRSRLSNRCANFGCNVLNWWTGSSFNSVNFSTISGGNYGLYATQAASNTVSNSYVEGLTAAYIAGSTGTVIANSVLTATAAAGSALFLGQGSVNLTVSSSVIVGGAAGSGVDINSGNSGVISLSSNAISGARYGVSIATQAAGAQIWITSNTIQPLISASLDTYGIYLNGLQTGATIYNNAVVYRAAGGLAGLKYYGLYGQSIAGLNFHHNRINQPGQVTGGSAIGAYFSATQATQFKFNDVNSTSSAVLQNAFLLQLANSTVTIRDNIFLSSVTVSVSSASLVADQSSGFDSDYNDWFSSHSAAEAVLLWGNKAYAYPWKSVLRKDLASISADPYWYNPSAAAEDFHPMSSASPQGRFDPASGAWATDAQHSASIDAGDYAEAAALEGDPLTSRVNLGSYGQTAEASRAIIIYSTVAGCGIIKNVRDAGGAGVDALTISAGLALLAPFSPFNDNACVVVRDTQTYAEQVTVQNFAFTLSTNVVRIMADPALSAGPAVDPPAGASAAFRILNDSVTLQNIRIIPSSALSYGVVSASASLVLNGVDVTDNGGNIAQAAVTISSGSSVVGSTITVAAANGLVMNGSGILLSISSVTSNSATKAALTIPGSNNTVSRSYISNPANWAAVLNSVNNTIDQSTITSDSAGGVALWINNASSYTITSSYIHSSGFTALDLDSVSFSTIAQNVIVTSGTTGYAMFLRGNSAYDYFSGNYFFNSVGIGVNMQNVGGSVHDNTLSASTIIGVVSGTTKRALQLVGASSNTITGSFISNSAGEAMRLTLAPYNTVKLSTVVSAAPDNIGLALDLSSYTTIANSYIQGSTSVYIAGSTRTVVVSSLLTSTAAAGYGLHMVAGNLGLSLSSSVVTAGGQGVGIFLDVNNSGVLDFTSNTVQGAGVGVQIAAQPSAASLSITTMTIGGSLPAGATAINFTGGILVSTFAAVNFADAAIAVNVNAAALSAGSRITMRGATGQRSGPLFENDPAGYVDWAEISPSSPSAVTAFQSGTANILAVQWSSPGDDGTIGTLPAGSEFRVQWTLTPNSVFWSTANAQVIIATGPVAAGVMVSTVVAGLASEQVIYFRVWARDAWGNYSVMSDTVSAFNSPFAFETVDNTPADSGRDTSLAVDRNGHLHLAYLYNDFFNLNYARYDGAWTLQALDGNTQGESRSVAVDVNGNPHIAYGYFNLTKYVLKYTSSTNGGDNFPGASASQIMDSAASSLGQYASLAIDGAGYAHISYRGPSNSLKYAQFNGVSWSTQTVDTGLGSVSSETALALDGAGNPRIAYFDGSAGAIKYAEWTGSAWSTQTVVASGPSYHLSLVLDGFENPHVSYYDAAGGDLKYAARVGSWNVQTVDSVGNVGDYNSITLDGSGKPHISYWDATNADLKYARFNGASWSTGTIDSNGTLGQYTSLTVDGTGDVHVSYQDAGSGYLKVAHWNGAGFLPAMGGNAHGKAQAPYNFNAAAVYYTSATWQWADGSFNELGFRLYGGSSAAGPFSMIVATTSIGANVVSYQETGLTPNTAYLRYAAAVNNGGIVASSGAAIVTLAVTPGPPLPGVSTFTVVNATAATLNWSSGTAAGGYNPSGTRYELQISTAFDFSGTVISSITYSLFAGTSNLNANTTYYFQVRALNNSGVPTLFVNLGSTSTLAASLVAGSFSNMGVYTIQANWTTVPSNPGWTLYELQTSTAPNFTGTVSSSLTYSQSGSYFPLSNNTTYYFQVRAINNNGVPTIFTDLGSTSTLAYFPYSLNFSAVPPALNSIRLDWLGNTNGPGTVYTAYISTAPNPLAPAAAVATTSRTFNTFVSTAGLGVNTTYYFQVKATNNNGIDSGYSAISATSTLASIPVAAVSTFSNVTPSQIDVNWLAGVQPNPSWTRYQLLTSTDSSFNGAVSSTITYNLSASTAGLTGDTVYYFAVRAFNSNDIATAYTDLGSTRTVLSTLPPPGGLAFPAVYTSSISASWSLVAGATGYFLAASTEPANPPVDIWASAILSGNGSSTATLNAPALDPNTTFYLFVRAVGPNITGLYAAFPATATLANPPITPAFTAFYSSMTLSWAPNANPGVTRYEVQLSTDNFADLFSSTVIAATAAAVIDLQANTTYYPRLRAVNHNEVGSAFLVFPTTSTLTAQPAALAPSLVGTSSITANWGSNGNAADTIYLAQISTDAFGTVNDSSFTANTSLAFVGLLSGNTYYFQVRAQGHNGSLTSFLALPTTATALSSPAPASPVFTGMNMNAITANWTSGGNGPATIYTAVISTDNFATINFTSNTPNLSVLFGAGGAGPNLIPNTTYYFRVTAGNWFAVSAPLVVGSTSTLAEPPAGLNFTASPPTASSIRFDWSSNNGPGVQYTVLASTAPNPGAPNGAVVTSSLTFNSFLSSSGLNANTTYYFSVKATNNNGLSTAYTAVVSTSSLASNPIFSLFTNVGLTQVQANWTSNAPLNPAWTSYEIQASTAPNFTGVVTSSLTYNLQLSSSGLSINTTYYFQVRAFNNNSVATAFASVGSTATLVYAPLAPLATVYFSSVALTWGNNGNPGNTVYLAQISTDNFSTVNDSSRTLNTAAAFLGLGSNTTYYLQVEALNHNSVASALAVIGATSTLPAQPVSAAPGYVGFSSITANWGTGGNAPTTLYTAQISTDNFSTVNDSSMTYNAFASFIGLLSNTTYFFQVRALGNNGNLTNFTALPTTTTLLLGPGMAAPVFSLLTASGVAVNWTAGGNGPQTVYVAQISTDNFASVNFSSTTLNLSAAFGTGGAGANLIPNATYFFRVYSSNGFSNSAPLVLGSTYTLAVPPSAAGPTYANGSSSGFTLNWGSGTAVSGYNDGASVYRAEISTMPGFMPTWAASAQSALSNAFSGLDPNTTYYARVAAYSLNAATWTAFTDLGSTVTAAALPGQAAAAFTLVSTDTLTINWTANGNPNGIFYHARMAASPGFSPILASSQTANVNATLFNLIPNTSYYFQTAVYNINTGTWSAYSFVGSTSTLANPPAAPVLAVSNSSITLSWGNNNNPSYTDYVAQISTNNFSTLNASSRTLNTSATFFGLVPNTVYYLQVQALNQNSVASAMVVLPATSTWATTPTAASPSGVGVSSITANWGANGNGPTTVYTAEISTDNFATINESSQTTNTSVAFTGLLFNTTYFFHVRAQGNDGTATSFMVLPATMTLLLPPGLGAPVFTTVDVGSITVNWTDGGNGPALNYAAQISTDNFSTVNFTSVTANVSALFQGLIANTTYFFRVRISSGSNGSIFTALGSTSTLANIPDAAVSTFTAVTSISISASWAPNGNPVNVTAYRLAASTDPVYPNNDAGNVLFSTVPAGSIPSATVSGLSSFSTYYLFVSAVNNNGIATPYFALGSTTTLGGLFPIVSNSQSGDNIWRRTNNGLYRVRFSDFSGAHLDRFQVKASSVAGGAGPDLIAFTDAVIGLSPGDTYVTDWPLPTAVFNSFVDGATNYVTVKVFNGLGNATTLLDAFYVRKDTTAPLLVDNQTGDSTVRTGAGTLYAVAAFDGASGLAAFQYSASLSAGAGDAALIAWTDIAAVSNSTSYTTNWPVNFTALANGVTNYISVRGWDAAGSTTTLVDAFYVLKDTVGPTVAIAAPAAAYVSALNQIIGTAAGTNPLLGVEVSIRENPSTGLYWSGSVFNSATPVWFAASGAASWSYTPGIVWTNGNSYQIVARSSDTLGLYSAPYSTSTFTFDSSTPTASVLVPTPNSTITFLSSISGTASDPSPTNSGLSAVEVRLRRLSDGLWWNFVNENWSSTPVSVIPSGTNSWSLTPSALLMANLANGTSYFIGVRASDNAAPPNSGDFFAAGSTFTFSDTTPPNAITDLAGVPGSALGTLKLTWTASGDDGSSGIILTGQYRVGYSTDPAAAFSTAAAQVAFSTGSVQPGSAQSRTLTGLNPGATYYARLWLSDDEGNWSGVSNPSTSSAMTAPSNQIQGHVVTVSTLGITAVEVNCWDSNGALTATTFTLADGSGTYVLPGLTPGTYKVQASWTANGITSSVWQDGIAMGSGNVDFVLEINYALATLTGSLSSLTAASRTGPLSVGLGGFAGSYVELHARGRRVASVPVGGSGRWTIPNLLPGRYSVRAFDGLAFTDFQDVDLVEGETRIIGFVFDPLPEKSVFAFPNPARDATTFRFESALWPLEAQILIFDIAGNLVRELPGSSMTSPSPGLYHVRWDLTNSRNQSVASGVYLFMVKLKGGSESQAAKVIKKVAVVR